jgi:Raf kinase inhibitor-like YbhB/YbcL family protein
MSCLASAFLAAVFLSAAGAQASAATPPDSPEGKIAMKVTSPAFRHQGSIPSRHTCDGANVSPALAWSDVPPGTASLALIVTDPDAPDPKAPTTTWTHWVLYGLPPDAKGLREAIPAKGLPDGTLEGTNDWGKTGYGGPCPPIGRHRYVFTLFAVDNVPAGLGTPTRSSLEKAMAGHILAQAELIGTYQRQ